MRQAEVARRAGDRAAPPAGELDDKIGLADEGPRHGYEVGLAAFDDGLHGRGGAHSAHEDDRLGHELAELSGRFEEVSLAVWR